MQKIFEYSNLNIYNGNKDARLKNIVVVSVFLVISFLFASRDLGIAKDDFNYLNYFYYARNLDYESVLRLLVEEPLWLLYTSSITMIIDFENSLRVTIFISVFLFLISAYKVNYAGVLIVVLVFFLHQNLATQMYFNQLRQGFALSLFLFITLYFKKPLIGGVLSTLIHTSFAFPFLIILLIGRVKAIKKIIIYSIIGVCLLYFSINFLENIDLGRRTESYEFEGKFTFNFYISMVLRYVPILWFLYFYNPIAKNSFWFQLALSSFIIIVPFTLFYNAAGRLVYYLGVFFLLLILEHFKSLSGKISLAYFLFFVIIDLFLFDSSVLSDLSLILKF